MGTLTDEQLHALRFLVRHPGGGTEATLLEQGVTVRQFGHLISSGLAKLRGTSHPKVFRLKIPAAGRKAIAE